MPLVEHSQQRLKDASGILCQPSSGTDQIGSRMNVSALETSLLGIVLGIGHPSEANILDRGKGEKLNILLLRCKYAVVFLLAVPCS